MQRRSPPFSFTEAVVRRVFAAVGAATRTPVRPLIAAPGQENKNLTDRPLSDDIFFIGHSLVGHDIPAFIQDFIGSTGGSGTVEKHIANGAPLKYQWENPGAGQGTNALDALSSGAYEAIVLAEAVPLRNHLEWSGSIDSAAQFAQTAVNANANAGTQIYVCEMWHSLNSGTGADVP